MNTVTSLMSRYGITLPRNAIEWRVAFNPEGTAGQPGIHILHGQVTELLTDGLVSWFLLGDHQTIFFGHKENFEPEIPEPKPRTFGPRPLSPKLQALALLD